jgi:UDP:flavonoid glycosyltransferase YjiC (YdhE family)
MVNFTAFSLLAREETAPRVCELRWRAFFLVHKRAGLGTHGDVRPFVALGLGLQRAGYRVTIATHVDFEGFVASHGLGFRPIGGSFKQLVESEAGREWLESSDSLSRYVATTKRVFKPLLRTWIDDTRAALLDAPGAHGDPRGHARQPGG